MIKKNRLDPNNSNKAKCKTCIFGSTPIYLTEKRKAEIHTYLATFKSSHVCHTTNLTCYGALEFQAKIMFAMGVIKENSVEEMLKEAAKHLRVMPENKVTKGKRLK